MSIRLRFVLWMVLAGVAHAHEGLHVEIDRLTEILRTNPDDEYARLQRARRLRLHHETDAALADLQKLSHEWHPYVAAERGLIRLPNHPDLAELDLQVAAETLNAASSWAALARARAAQGCTQGALQALRRALDQRPDLEDYLLGAELLREIGNPAEAIHWYHLGEQAIGPALLLRQRTIETALEAGRPLDALAELTADRERQPHLLLWRLLEARAYAEAGDTTTATQLRLKILKEVDQQLGARPTLLRRLQRSELLWVLNRHQDARSELSHVLRQAPHLAAAQTLRDRFQAEATTKEP